MMGVDLKAIRGKSAAAQAPMRRLETLSLIRRDVNFNLGHPSAASRYVTMRLLVNQPIEPWPSSYTNCLKSLSIRLSIRNRQLLSEPDVLLARRSQFKTSLQKDWSHD